MARVTRWLPTAEERRAAVLVDDGAVLVDDGGEASGDVPAE